MGVIIESPAAHRCSAPHQNRYGLVHRPASGTTERLQVDSLGRAAKELGSIVAYPMSKAALNMLTVQYARAFPRWRVNSVTPGLTLTADSIRLRVEGQRPHGAADVDDYWGHTRLQQGCARNEHPGRADDIRCEHGLALRVDGMAGLSEASGELEADTSRGSRDEDGGHGSSLHCMLEHIASLIAKGRLTVPIAARYPIEQIGDAVRFQATRHARGKVVITL